jgi:tetratricopeptide (TPR) repeat protein
MRRLVRAASVFGPAFWRGGVEVLLGGPVAAAGLDARLAALEARELVSRRTPARFRDEREYVFRHALLRDAAYATLTADDRRTGHRLAGDWLAGAGETDPLVLAEHHERGGSAAAADAFLRAAREALERNDLPGALDRVSRGLAARAGSETLGRLLLVRAEALIHTGHMADARGAAADAAALLPTGSEGWFLAARAHSIAVTALGDGAELTAVAARVRAAEPAPGQASLRIGVLAVLAGNLAMQGPPGVGMAVLAEAEEHARTAGPLDRLDAARLHQARARRCLLAADLAGAITETEGAIAVLERTGRTRASNLLRHDAAFLRLELGLVAEAHDALRALIELGERTGLPNLVANALENLATVLTRLGRPREALAAVDRALAHYVRHPNVRQEGSARIVRAHVLIALGDPGAAEAEATIAAALLAGRPALCAYALATRARLKVAAGRAADARADAAEAARALAAGVEAGESAIHLAQAEVLDALGDRAAARAAIRAARDALQARAAALDDATRRAFLEKVPDNARILALAAAWDVG